MFSDVPHLMSPVAVEVSDAIALLESVVVEMAGRYTRLEAAGVRNIAELPDAPPYLVLVIDELADLMMTGKKRAEEPIVRLLQMGRAAGIHLVLATQRPSTDVVTGLIKTNTPSRMVFAVSSSTDSVVALGQSGAQALLGQGDGLWWPAGARMPERVQAPYVSTQELSDLLEPLERVDVEATTLYEDEQGLEPEPVLVDDELVVPDEIPDEELTTDDRLVALERRMETERLLAYETGLANAAALAPSYPLREHRMSRPKDRWLAVLIFLAVVGLGAAIGDMLPLLVAGYVAYVIDRRRRKIKNY
jgi:DNA segregation ATPase FtsK/SpoIIIE-like protein